MHSSKRQVYYLKVNELQCLLVLGCTFIALRDTSNMRSPKATLPDSRH